MWNSARHFTFEAVTASTKSKTIDMKTFLFYLTLIYDFYKSSFDNYQVNYFDIIYLCSVHVLPTIPDLIWGSADVDNLWYIYSALLSYQMIKNTYVFGFINSSNRKKLYLWRIIMLLLPLSIKYSTTKI